MFYHNFKYTLKNLFRNKMLIFWTFAFPIILGTFFHLAFRNIESGEMLDVIDVAVIDADLDDTTKAIFDGLVQEDVLKVTYTNLEEAQALLNNKQISGFVVFNDSPQVVVKQNGIEETVLQYIVEEIVQNKALLNDLISNSPQDKLESVISNITNKVNLINDKSHNNLSYTMIEYYTLIAMTCLYGAMLGVYTINNTLANMSKKGMRVETSPIKKRYLLFSSLSASYVTQLIGLALLFLYTIMVLKVDYGNHMLLVILLMLVGSLAGLAFGTFVGTVIKKGESTKIGIIISFTMLGSYLSGMMGIAMKYIVDKYVPLINKVNPANMITDGFYSLYYYDTLNRFWWNIISLIIFSILMVFLSLIKLRRQKYDSI